MLAALARRPLVAALLIGIAAQILFSVYLGRPAMIMFDEIHYVGAARILLDLTYRVNTEHPVLGKTLIAASMMMFGDNPVGWRALSTVAGTASVLGSFWLMWLWFRRVDLAASAAILAMLNQFLFIHARIAMLDSFLTAFLVLGIASLVWAGQAERGRAWPRLLLAGILFGFAVGVKWAAIPYVALACLCCLFVPTATRWRFTTRLMASVLFGSVAILYYLLTFIPDFFLAYKPLTMAQLIPFQFEMYAQQTQVLRPHPYQSTWSTWPLMIRPIWYLYEPVAGIQRGVLLIGNPAIFWGGLVAVAMCIWAGWVRGHRVMLGIGMLWVFSLAIWAIIPKSLGFFYYYQLSALWLCLAIPPAIDRYLTPRWRYSPYAFIALSAVLFVYFYPIISAAPLDNDQAFNHWMWFKSWR